MERQGEAWAARKEVIVRMATALTEGSELIVYHLLSSGPVKISVSFDEYNLDAQISYSGKLLPLPEKTTR